MIYSIAKIIRFPIFFLIVLSFRMGRSCTASGAPKPPAGQRWVTNRSCPDQRTCFHIHLPLATPLTSIIGSLPVFWCFFSNSKVDIEAFRLTETRKLLIFGRSATVKYSKHINEVGNTDGWRWRRTSMKTLNHEQSLTSCSKCNLLFCHF